MHWRESRPSRLTDRWRSDRESCSSSDGTGREGARRDLGQGDDHLVDEWSSSTRKGREAAMHFIDAPTEANCVNDLPDGADLAPE